MFDAVQILGFCILSASIGELIVLIGVLLLEKSSRD